MSFTSWLRNLRSALMPSPLEYRRQRSRRATTHRLGLEVLEDRCLPSTFTVLNLNDSGADSLRAAVTAANANPGPDTIDFATTGTIALTSGQLDVTDSVTINGPGAVALTVSGERLSRVFAIAGDPTVVIAGLTVANGWTSDSPGGGIAMAGGILTLDHATVSGNSAVGVDYSAGNGLGGGLYVAGGTLTLDQCTVFGNYAVGGQGGWEDGEYEGEYYSMGYTGGLGVGGGVYVAGGTVYVNQSTVAGNHAWGGAGGRGPYYAYFGIGGDASGGGIWVNAGALEIYQSSIFDNEAFGGVAGSYIGAYDGRSTAGGLGIHLNEPTRVVLDTFTESNTVNNIAGINPNIEGPYSLNGPIVPTLAISDVTTAEGNTGTHAITFTVSLSSAASLPVTVNFATADGSATAGSDYLSDSGTLTFAPGQTSKMVTVQLIGDRLVETNEWFSIDLSGPTNAVITDSQGVGTVVDDEPRISINNVSKNEGKNRKTTLFTFTVTLSAAYDQPVTMSFQTVNGSGTTANNDYIAKTGTLTFAPGETTKTITIEVKGDSTKEADETFYLDLFGTSGNSLFTKNRGAGTILNDD